MKHLYSLLLVFVVSFAATLVAAAQGKSYVGYSDGKIATSTSGKYTSIGAVGNDVSIAIRLPKSMLASYKGNTIVGVNYGMPTSQGVKKLTGWVRTSLDGKNLTEGSTTSTNFGWREISVTPYTITGNETELWIGATYTNDSKAYVAVSFAGTTVTDGCYVNNGGVWTNYATQGWGSLSLEAIIEGDNVATHDLALVDVTTRQRSVQVGDPISVSGIIKNNASESAVKPVIRYSINGQNLGSYTYNGTLAFRQSDNFSFEIPTTSFNTALTANVSLSLEWADGTPDDAPADNVANFSVELSKEVFKRRMVVEEHTGAGCGWCPRGIVGLKEMKERYGDDFIGIGIHSSGQGPDPYTIADYNNFIGGFISNLPNSIINRSGSGVDPSYENLVSHYQSMDAQADADITVEATYDTEGNINFTAHSRFAFSETNADYRVAFVVLENQLPIRQTNYYSGRTSVMGGFEKMGSTVDILIDDVARGIYPNPAGDKGSIPASVTKGEVYDYSYSVRPTFTDGENVEVVALLLNGKTGEIMNGVKTANIVGLTNGTPVDPVNPGGGDDDKPVIVPLTHTFSPAEGAIVETLDKVVINFQGTYAEQGMNHVGYYNYMAAADVPIESRPYLRDAKGQVVTKAARIMWTYNDIYGGLADFENNPYHYNEFEFDFDGVPAGDYTLVIPKKFFVYYDYEEILCGTKEITADYTVTKTSTHTWAGQYDARFTPAENTSLKEFGVVTLHSSDDIYNYTNTDLATYYNYFYVEEAERPYVILPSGKKQEVKTVDFAETTGVSNGEALIVLTFPTSYAEGAYTVVIPQDFIVVCDTNYKYRDWWKAYAAPERRFTFFVGDIPEGIAAPSMDEAPSTIYDLWGRGAGKHATPALRIEAGRKVIR